MMQRTVITTVRASTFVSLSEAPTSLMDFCTMLYFFNSPAEDACAQLDRFQYKLQVCEYSGISL